MSDKVSTNNSNSLTILVDRKTAAEFLGVKPNTLTIWAMQKKHNLP